jgi:glucose dehydrogenase
MHVAEIGRRFRLQGTSAVQGSQRFFPAIEARAKNGPCGSYARESCRSSAYANDELIKLSQDAKQWVMPAGNYAATRYSTRKQITATNVKDLKVAWTFSTGVLRGHEG